MEIGEQEQHISREAAAVAIKWKTWFATELQESAERYAAGSETISIDHFHQAIPDALNAFVKRVEAEAAPSDARSKAA